jgi:hypothetical protein
VSIYKEALHAKKLIMTACHRARKGCCTVRDRHRVCTVSATCSMNTACACRVRPHNTTKSCPTLGNHQHPTVNRHSQPQRQRHQCCTRPRLLTCAARSYALETPAAYASQTASLAALSVHDPRPAAQHNRQTVSLYHEQTTAGQLRTRQHHGPCKSRHLLATTSSSTADM